MLMLLPRGRYHKSLIKNKNKIKIEVEVLEKMEVKYLDFIFQRDI
jgi:hypothetical protein